MVRLIDRVYLIQNDAFSYFLAVLYVQIINLEPPGENKKVKEGNPLPLKMCPINIKTSLPQRNYQGTSIYFSLIKFSIANKLWKRKFL